MIMSTKADTTMLHMSPDIYYDGNTKEEPILCERWLIVILLLSK